MIRAIIRSGMSTVNTSWVINGFSHYFVLVGEARKGAASRSSEGVQHFLVGAAAKLEYPRRDIMGDRNMNKKQLTRRQFVTAASAGSLALSASRKVSAHEIMSGDAGKLAILGGTPVRQNKPWPEWPNPAPRTPPTARRRSCCCW